MTTAERHETDKVGELDAMVGMDERDTARHRGASTATIASGSAARSDSRCEATTRDTPIGWAIGCATGLRVRAAAWPQEWLTLSAVALGLVALSLVLGVLAHANATVAVGQSALRGLSAGDTAWVLLAAALVLLMTPAVGFFYGGMVASKNVVSLIKQSVLILSVVSVQWVLFGYSLVFGPDIGGLIGNLRFAAFHDVGVAPNPTYAATIPQMAFAAFQLMFAAVTPALIIGAFAGRMRFRALVLFVPLWTTLVYDPIAHWVWGAGGWLRALGALDFAGGTVVHMSAGFAGLAAALVVGRRRDYRAGAALSANNVPLVLLGVALLWFGWFGFNAGSALAASPLAANAFVTTNTAAAAAALTWMLLSWAETGKPGAMAAGTGAVCGLVAITPACGFVGPLAALIIGVIAGLVTYLAMLVRARATRIDDTLDVWAAHGMGGLVGALLTGVFAEAAINSGGANGLLFGNPAQFGVQMLAVLVTGGFAFVATALLLLGLRALPGVGLRVSEAEEAMGLDRAIHGEKGYRL